MGTAGIALALLAQSEALVSDRSEPAKAADVVVTASRTAPEQPASDRVDRRKIIQLQPVTLTDALNRSPGVYAVQTGGAAGDTFLSIRGGEPNFTSVEIDGIRVNDPTNSSGGSFDLAQLPPSAVAMINVSRTPLSAVHGADALSGLVQLSLVSPEAGKTTLDLAGNVDTAASGGVEAMARSGWASGGVLVAGAVEGSGRLTPGSTLTRRSLLATALQDLGRWRLRMTGLHAETDRNRFPEDSGGIRLASNRALESRTTTLDLAGLTVSRPGTLFSPRISASWSGQYGRSDTPAIAPGVFSGVPAITGTDRFSRTAIAAGAVARPSDQLTLATGLEFVDELGQGRGSIFFGRPVPTSFRVRRNNVGIYGETTYRPIPLLDLTGAIRFDGPSSRPGETTYRFSSTVRPGDGSTSFSVSYAEAFKLPSIYALAYPLIANPDLRPERARGVQGTLAWRRGTGRIAINVFRTVYRDLIDFDPVLFTDVNRSRVVTRGLEVAAGLERGRLSADGSVTYVDVESATPLRSRPRWSGAATLNWNSTSATGFFVGGRFNSNFLNSSVPTGLIDVPGHVELDVGAHHAITRAVTMDLVVRNIADAHYEEAVGFPAPGRVARLTIRFSI